MSVLSEKDKAVFRALIAESVGCGLTPEDQAKLETILRSSRAAKKYYIECLGLYTDLNDLAGSDEVMKLSPADSKSCNFRFRRPLWIVSAASIVALVLLGLFLSWPWISPGPQVGTIVDSLDLQAGWLFPKEPGRKLFLAQARTRIKTGVVHVRLDQGVDLILEGPCCFELVSPSLITLKRGRLYAHVVDEGRGFTVRTSNTEMVDIGTEFGVVSYGTQGAEIHVITGQVEVRQGSDQTHSPESVVSGHALRISAQGDVTRDIPYDPQAFVRRIDSNSHFAWRGQNTLDLADVVAGGDGFGTGRSGYEIEPLSGAFRAIQGQAYDRQGDYRYHPVEALPFVDGVFIPDGGVGPVRVASAGHEFAQCPDTCNIFFSELLGCSMKLKGPVEGRLRGLVLNDIEYADGNRSGIFMHANLGVTFDLQRIRQALGSDLTIQRFESVAGISEATNVPEVGDMDLWILIDGQVVYAHQNIKVGQAQPVSIPIEVESRFLTLATTDSQSDNGDFVDTFADWGTFGQPRLILKSKIITNDPGVGR